MELKIYFRERLSGKGEWITFPLSLSEFEGRIRSICRGAPTGAEHFLEVYDVDGPDGSPDFTTENFNFEEVNKLAREIACIDKEDWEVVDCLTHNGYDLSRACRIVRNNDYLDLRNECDEEAVVRACLDDDGTYDLPSYIEDNIDWYAAFEDLKNYEDLYKCGDGYIRVY